MTRVAIFQTALLGDTVLTLPLVRQVRDQLRPDALVVVTKPELAFVFSGEECTVLEDDKQGQNRGVRGFFRMVSALRQNQFDMALVPHRSLRSALLAWMARIPIRVGFVGSSGWFLFNRLAPFDHVQHDSERNLRLLKMVSAPKASQAASDSFAIRLHPEDKQKAAALWRRWDVQPQKEFLVGMAPGASRRTKQWLPDRFATVARQLKQQHPECRIVLFGGPEDHLLCEDVAAQIGSSALNLAGQSRLEELPGLLSDLKLFVTNDSGPMHIAYGLGIPTVAIFGPTVKEFGYYPKGPASRMVEAEGLPCRPCGLHGSKTCPEGHFLCMKQITEDHVLQACQEVLAS